MTLTEIAYYTRRIIKYGALLAVGVIVVIILWKITFGIYRFFFPAPPPAPELKFGKLPSLLFDQKQIQTKLTFSLQTPTGDLPTNFPAILPVYFMPTTKTSFLDLDDARKIARNLGFSGTGIPVSQVIYSFNNSGNSATLQMNIVNKAFSINYDFAKNPDILSLRPRSETEAETIVKNFLSSASLLPTDLQDGLITTQFLASRPPNLVPVSSLSQANFIRVDLFRHDYNGLPVLTPQKGRGNVWFLVSGESQSNSIVAGEYHYFPAAAEQSSTYPVKGVKEAWSELTNGTGLIVSPPEGSQTQVIIRRVYLAYYDSGKPQQFLEPVVVFDGDNNFRAFIPAVTSTYYGGN